MSDEHGQLHEIERVIILDPDNPIMRLDPETAEIPIDSRLDGYIFSCAQSLSLISASIEKADISIVLLKNSYATRLESTPFTPAELIEFAIENYFIRSATIYDRCLIFTNKLLDLGIANESITHELLVTNAHVTKLGLDLALKKIRKVCTEYRIERNKIVHHGRYSAEEFGRVSMMHKANDLSVQMRMSPPIPKEAVDHLTNDIIETKAQEFSTHLDRIKSQVRGFFDCALPAYGNKKRELDSK